MSAPAASPTNGHPSNQLPDDVMHEDTTSVEHAADQLHPQAAEEDEDADPVGDGQADFQVVRRRQPLGDSATQPNREPSHQPISEPVAEPVTEPEADPINEPGNDAPNLTDEDAIPSDDDSSYRVDYDIDGVDGGVDSGVDGEVGDGVNDAVNDGVNDDRVRSVRRGPA
jgi:hypothetical protein